MNIKNQKNNVFLHIHNACLTKQYIYPLCLKSGCTLLPRFFLREYIYSLGKIIIWSPVYNIFCPVAQWTNVLYFGAKSNRRYRIHTEIIRACALRIYLKWINHPECTKHLIIGINRTVTEAYESHRLIAYLRRQNGIRLFFIDILLIISSAIISNKDLLKTRFIFNLYAHISCKNDWNNFLLLNTNAPLCKCKKIPLCLKIKPLL